MLSLQLQATVNSSSNNKLQNAPEFKPVKLNFNQVMIFFVLNQMSAWMDRLGGWVITTSISNQ